ncbi:hypothetical protein HK096_009075, partial [Nowakowskiella sp. JEL0078]
LATSENPNQNFNSPFGNSGKSDFDALPKIGNFSTTKIPSVESSQRRSTHNPTSTLMTDFNITTGNSLSEQQFSLDLSTTFPSHSFPSDRLDSFLESTDQPLIFQSEIENKIEQLKQNSFSGSILPEFQELENGRNMYTAKGNSSTHNPLETIASFPKPWKTDDISNTSKLKSQKLSQPSDIPNKQFSQPSNIPNKQFDPTQSYILSQNSHLETPVSVSEADYLPQLQEISFEQKPPILQRSLNGSRDLRFTKASDFNVSESKNYRGFTGLPKEYDNEAVISVLRSLQERIAALEEERLAAKDHIARLESELAKLRQMEFRRSVVASEQERKVELEKSPRKEYSPSHHQAHLDQFQNTQKRDQVDYQLELENQMRQQKRELEEEMQRKFNEFEESRRELELKKQERLTRELTLQQKQDPLENVDSSWPRRENIDRESEREQINLARQREMEFREELRAQLENEHRELEEIRLERQKSSLLENTGSLALDKQSVDAPSPREFDDVDFSERQ